MAVSIEKLVKQIQEGGPLSCRAAARLMTILTDEPQRLVELLAGSQHWPQPSLVLGVTGAPGSGKSTLVDHLAIDYRLRYPDKKIGIIAVDPSSPFTGGAILGDRVRMMRHSTDPNIFIRSLASRGHLGGLTLGVRGIVRVMGLLGCDVVFIETVGVGQSEVEIAKSADTVLIVLAPGQGDSVQLLKAGLMEAGDLFVVNKGDRPEALQLRQQLLMTLRTASLATSDHHWGHQDPANQSSELPNVYVCSAAHHEGIEAITSELQRLTEHKSSEWQTKRQAHALAEIRQAVFEEVQRRVEGIIGSNGTGEANLRTILDGSKSLKCFVDDLLQRSNTTSQANIGNTEFSVTAEDNGYLVKQ